MFKKNLLTVIILSLFIGVVCTDVQYPGPLPGTLELPRGEMLSPQRTAPTYSFSRAPYSIMTSFYDYMIGSYNGLPLRLVPESAGGGYFMTYHGQRNATSLRRVFYAYLNPAGNLVNNSEITLNNIREGYPTLAVDPVSGKPLYAWHDNADTDGVFFPNNPFSTLSSLSDGKGYYVKATQPCILQIAGTPVDVSTAIPLQTGWNLCAFTPQSSLAVGVALASIANNLQEVKGVEGVYIPGNPLNTLSTLSPGRAYWIKLSSAAALVYPASGKSDAQAAAPPCEVWGNPIVKTNSQVVLTKVVNNAISGDLLGAFVDNELRGLAELQQVDGKLAALLQVFTEESGEKVQFKLYRPDGKIIYSLSPGMDSAPGETIGNYQTGDFLSLKLDLPDTPAIDTELLYAYPNPFKSGTSIALNVAKDAPTLKVEVYNLRGQKVSTLFNGQMLPGASKLWWNGLDDGGNQVASGVYFCRMIGGKSSQSIKLLILK